MGAVDRRDDTAKAIVRRGPDDPYSRADRNALRHLQFAAAVLSFELVGHPLFADLPPERGPPEHTVARAAQYRTVAALRLDPQL